MCDVGKNDAMCIEMQNSRAMMHLECNGNSLYDIHMLPLIYNKILQQLVWILSRRENFLDKIFDLRFYGKIGILFFLFQKLFHHNT